MPQHSLAGGEVDIGGDEAANLRVVISALEIVPSCFGWVLLCTRRGCPPPGHFFGRLFSEKEMDLLCTSKHRLWSLKQRLVRNIPETFKGLGLSKRTAFCPQKAMLADILIKTLNSLAVSKHLMLLALRRLK